MRCFKNNHHLDLHYVNAAKCASRTVVGWMVLIGEPKLYTARPDWFPEIPDKRDHAYSEIRRYLSKHKVPNDAKTVFCIKRDPIERFISCYQNMNWLGHIGSLDKLINNWDELMATRPVLYTHFRSQTEFYGNDKNKFTHIFDHTKMHEVREFLEDYAQVSLPKLHLQQSGTKKEVELTKELISWIQDKYEEDYNNGWI